ncbi:MAG: hypothetical protein NVSMB9_19350 [Isosphaeraceae bacterium]
MISLWIAHITLGIYALLLAVGGVMGFVKARSRASLISGLLSSAFALVALGLSLAKFRFGFPLGMLLAVVLFVLFGYRYALRNRKFMPNGMLAVVSLVVIGVMIVVLDWSS